MRTKMGGGEANELTHVHLVLLAPKQLIRQPELIQERLHIILLRLRLDCLLLHRLDRLRLHCSCQRLGWRQQQVLHLLLRLIRIRLSGTRLPDRLGGLAPGVG